MGARPVNLLVFREHRRQVRSQSAVADLLQACTRNVLDALLFAGEIECGVADAAPERAASWQAVTDSLADALVRGADPLQLGRLTSFIQSLSAPELLSISPPEGFAYYALHPMAYADILNASCRLPDEAAVVGIRSIGTTLSAVTSAAERKQGLRSSRITVRPHGHPYNRKAQFTPEQLAWITEKVRIGAAFLVVDEGPGLSGSSFISVAEALVEAGAPPKSISLICGHTPDLNSLCAQNGSHRARQFRWLAVDPEPYRPATAQTSIGGGEWRRLLFSEESSWPASWTNFERLKYLTAPDGEPRDLLKFMGFGRYGGEVFSRERVVADAGFGPAPAEMTDGFARFPWIHGSAMRADDLSEDVLARLAAYCAFRAGAFQRESCEITALQQMAEHNLHELKLNLPVSLRLECPVISDGRMQPHEWVLTGCGKILKTDSGAHGDDHFFPGPTDIAWDLAGAIVEWRMSSAAQGFFVNAYQRASGDDPHSRLADYLIAYAAFRRGYCTMAANALHGAERIRLERAAAEYGSRLRECPEAAAAFTV